MRQHPLSSTTGHAESTSPASSTCSGVTDSADPSVIALRRPSAFGVDSRPSELSRGVQEPHLPASRQLSYSSADVSARNCWQHALLACHVSRDSECSLAARRAGEDCGHVLEASPLRSIAGIGHKRLRPTRQPSSSRTVGAVDRTRDRVFDELVGRWQSVHQRSGQRRFSSDHQAELLGRIVRVHL
jgi:hypothetical protein